MSEGRRWWVIPIALLLAVVGFALGAAGSAWQTREQRAEPWRKMRVEHQGTDGVTTRTRVIFENPKLPLQAVEVIRSPEGVPERAHVALQDATELTVHYRPEQKGRPSSLAGPDGARAELSYKGSKAKVTFFGADGEEIGAKQVAVPVTLRPALELARAEARPRSAFGLAELGGLVIGQAQAQEGDEKDESVTIERDVSVVLDINVPGAKDADTGRAELETSCPAPFTCLPATPDAKMPGQSNVRINVSASTTRSKLKKTPGSQDLEPFKKTAAEERSVAATVLPDVATVVAAVGVTALACKSLKLAGPICVPKLRKSATSTAGAITSLTSHEVEVEGRVISERATELYYEELARKAADRETRIELCASRDGFARVCTNIDVHPFGPEPAAAENRKLDLRRGIGGTLVGSFVMTQSDQSSDCKFSPSPKTSGALRLRFDSERHTVSASAKANERGTRPNLSCSLGTANMSWSQNYSITATQTFTAEQLQSGGKLTLRLKGNMSGRGNFSFSNCRSSGGASANCPGGKGDSYSYPIEIVGALDLTTRQGSGRIAVQNAQLPTRGTWRIPAGDAK